MPIGNDVTIRIRGCVPRKCNWQRQVGFVVRVVVRRECENGYSGAGVTSDLIRQQVRLRKLRVAGHHHVCNAIVFPVSGNDAAARLLSHI